MAAGNVVYISMYKMTKLIFMWKCVWYETYVDVELKFMNSKWNRNQDSQLICYLATKLQDICPELTESIFHRFYYE